MKPHKTAITRSKLPVPTRDLLVQGCLKGDVLDFGCGKCHEINNSHFSCDGYDPYFRPIFPNKKYDTIVCNYVLNVVPPETQSKILDEIRGLLKPNGVAYVSVRRDIKENYTTKDTEQYVVKLDCASLVRNSSYEIYRVIMK